jgi:phage shock protein PspC (stress-responsive transcriptional regulator)
MLFGVCKTLAQRNGHEAWPYRLGAVVSLLFWTIPTVGIYCFLGLLLPETKVRTYGVFKGLFIMLQEWVEKALVCLQDLFNPRGRGNTPR